MRLVRQGLELLAKNNMTAIARLLECTPAQAQAAARAVRALNPRPAQGYGAGPLAYQIPEAVFRRENGQVVIELERRLAPPAAAARAELHAAAAKRQPPRPKTYLKERRAEAQQLMRAVAERESTLVRLLRQLARDQQDFFLQGGPLKPMTLTQMAQSLGLSLSTVSRAVQGKTLQFEGRSLPLKRFFSAGVPVEGGQVSSESIKRQLQRFVQADPAKPLSDEALRAALEAVNLPVARRTVAKYREELGIPSSSARRRVE